MRDATENRNRPEGEPRAFVGRKYQLLSIGEPIHLLKTRAQLLRQGNVVDLSGLDYAQVEAFGVREGQVFAIG